jgi:hypothetical protein
MTRSLTFLKRRERLVFFQALAWLILVPTIHSFASVKRRLPIQTKSSIPVFSSSEPTIFRCDASVDSVEEASRILSEWDSKSNPEITVQQELLYVDESMMGLRNALEPSIRLLSGIATDDRNLDPTQGRCMLGICAPNAQEGVAALKAWVTALALPRGLLHGMDKDGVPIDLSGAVYVKYNSGGVYTFADIRKSKLGFDALWKPGDALLEPYDGTYRGVYFQVELQDEEFRQYLVPLDVF